MKITVESTKKAVELVVGPQRNKVQARVWQGFTDSGVPVQCFITRIAPEIDKDRTDPLAKETFDRFEAELLVCADPRPEVEAIPLRLII